MADSAAVAAVAAAQAQGERDVQHRQDYYQARAGVPAGTTGEPVNAPLPLPDDPAVTGVGGVPGVPGGAR
jgi:hypothetical protein